MVAESTTGEKNASESRVSGEVEKGMDPSGDEDDSKDFVRRSVGHFGKWQLITCLLLSLSKVPIAWHQLGFVFLAPSINFTCIEAGERVGPGILWGFFDANITNQGRCHIDGEECTKWWYDNSTFTSTIVTEWDLVCKNEDLVDIGQMLFMFGVLLGSFIAGMAADKWGRKNPLLATIFLQIVSGVATAYATNYVLFQIIRFIDAFATGGQMVISFVICMEILSKKWRSIVSNLYHVPFFVGHCSLAIIAYFFRDWRDYQLAISLPVIVFVVYWWTVPESPRWLMTVGRKEEALQVLQKGAKMNKLPKPEMDIFEESVSAKPASKGNMMDLFRTPQLRKRSICIFMNWISTGLGLFGLAHYISVIEGDIFINVTISGAMEVPGSLLCIVLMEKLGRKTTLLLSNIISGVACLLILVVPEDADPMITVALAAIGIVGMSMCFPTVYLYTGELYPTVVRNIGIGIASMFARVGSMVAPFVVRLGGIVPPLVFGIFPVVGAILTLLLPETKNTRLSNTIEEAENYDFSRSKRTGEDNKGFHSTETAAGK